VLVLSSEDAARRAPKPVWIRGIGWASDSPWLAMRSWDQASYAQLSATMAYTMAGITDPPREILSPNSMTPTPTRNCNTSRQLNLPPAGRPRAGLWTGARAWTGVSGKPFRWISWDGVLFRCHGVVPDSGSGPATPWGGGSSASSQCEHGARALVEGCSHANRGRDGARGLVAESGPMSFEQAEADTSRGCYRGGPDPVHASRARNRERALYYAASQALETSGVRLKDIGAVVMATAPDAFDGVHMKGEWLLDGAGATASRICARMSVGGRESSALSAAG